MSSLHSQGATRARVPVSYSNAGSHSSPRASICLLAGLLALACLGISQAARADVLVVAPHPDDDVITSAGVMLRARQAGETVRVMFMTNGDAQGMTAGLKREDEAVAAEALLGVAEDNMIFLGYPDGYLSDLRGPYFGSGTALTGSSGLNHTFGDRGLGRMDYHHFAFGSSADNNGTNVITDITNVLSTYRPSDIFVTSEFDRHPDHAATYQFVMEGIASVRSTSPSYNPTVHKTIVWNDFNNTAAWPLPQDPTTYITEPPDLLSRTGLVWSQREALDVPLDAQVMPTLANLKWRAIDSHDTQGGADPGSYIDQFVHKDEWFFTARASGTDRPPVPNAGADRTANAGESVQLNGSASFDPDGSALSYQWRQTSGPSVSLSSASAAQPTFTVPASTTTATVFAFELKVSDGTSTSVADSVSVLVNTSVVTLPPPPAGTNLAPYATASASSQANQQEASKVCDGFTDGYPTNASHEWASNGQGVNAWVQLTWPTAQTIDQVVLFDRPNADDRVMAGTLTFSSGASVAVGALDNAGTALVVPVSSRSVTWVRFTVTSVAANTYNVGLAELQVFNTSGTVNPPPVNQAPVANAGANQSVAQGATVTLHGSGTDPEGAALSYDWAQTLGPAVLTVDNTPNPTFVAPSGASTDVTLTFELVVSDGVNPSAPSTVTVTVLAPVAPPPPAPAPNLALTATATASTAALNQGASKVKDGFTDGYPSAPTHEWVTLGQRAGAWVKLAWNSAQKVSSVKLYDRPRLDENVLSGTLTFSDGSSVRVGALTNSGAPVTVSFATRSVKWVRFTVNSVSATTRNVGLAEFEVR